MNPHMIFVVGDKDSDLGGFPGCRACLEEIEVQV